jgi:hypothetical protein
VIPLPELGLELLLGLGAALFIGNAAALLRPWIARRRGTGPVPRPPSTTRVVVYMLFGAVVAVWALATILARR